MISIYHRLIPLSAFISIAKVVKYLSVGARINGLLIVIVVANVCAFTQDVREPALPAPRILIDLPGNIPSDAVWIRYVLIGPGGSGGAIVKREPDLRQYVIDAIIGVKPARRAKIVVYAPGCQFKTYTIDLDGASDVSELFQCDSLPSRTVHGILPPAQLPSSIFTDEKRLVIFGELEPDWVCDFFLQHIGGSCLGAGIPLGKVGEIDPANGGAFEITIPDFTADQVFKGAGDVPRSGKFGEIELVLQDKKIGRPLGGIQPENAAPKTGLNIESEYPNPLKFMTVR